MFARTYFGAAFFAPRYWPGVVSGPPPTPPPPTEPTFKERRRRARPIPIEPPAGLPKLSPRPSFPPPLAPLDLDFPAPRKRLVINDDNEILAVTVDPLFWMEDET